MTASQVPVQATSAWTDIQGLASLAGAARTNSKAALPVVARQFEALFTEMMIKSMRDASFGGGLLDSPQQDQWRDVFDNQVALSMANDGKGLGIAAMLDRQLGSKTKSIAAAQAGPAALTHARPLPLKPSDATALAPQLRAARTVEAALANAPAGANGVDTVPATGNTGGVVDRALAFARTAGSQALDAARQLFSSPEDFVQKLAPYAQAAAKKLGVSVRVVLAQAALETGWGQHMPQAANGSSSFNLFGIKAGQNWNGQRVTVPTVEFENGAAVRGNASFRAYPGPQPSFADYTHLLTHDPRYAGALGTGNDVAAFAKALGQAGYATDPAYAAKLTAIANGSTMQHALAALKNPAPQPTTAT